MPPPPPVPIGPRPEQVEQFQADSLIYEPPVPACRFVPPTPTTFGSLAGESTARLVSSQSYAPESPEAAKTACPWAAPCEKIWLSEESSEVPDDASHKPQLVLVTLARLSVTILL